MAHSQQASVAPRHTMPRGVGESAEQWASSFPRPLKRFSFPGRSLVLLVLALAAQLASTTTPVQAPVRAAMPSSQASPTRPDSGPSVPRPRRILLLFENTTQTPAVTLIEQALRERLQNDGDGTRESQDIELFEEHLRLGESESAATTQLTYSYLRQKYATRPDLVIGVALPHAAVARLAAGAVVGDVPVVLLSSDTAEMRAAARAGRVTGVAVLPDVTGTVKLLLKTHPRTRHLFVVLGTSDFERAVERSVREQLRGFAKQLDVEYASAMSLPDIVRRGESLGPGSAMLYVSMARDGNGTRRMSIPSLEQIARVTTAPIYGASATHLGHGIVGGALVDFAVLGDRAAIQAKDVLDGMAPSSIPIDMRAATSFQFDWAQLQRLHIDEALLPRGSVVIGRIPTPWERYRWLMVSLVIVLVLETTLIAALLQQFRQRHAAERARETYRQLEVLLVRLSAKLVAATVSQIDSTAAEVLAQAAEFLGVDRAMLATFDDPGPTLRILHGWTAPGVPAVVRPLGVEDIPAAWEQLRRGERLLVDSLSQLPAHLESDRAGFVKVGMKSGVAFPLMAGERCLGVLGVSMVREERVWDPGLVDGLSVLADLLASSLVRRRAELDAAQRREELSHLARVGIVGELSASLAHEINQPLGAIILSVQAAQRWLAGGRAEPREVGRLLERVSSDVQRAYSIIDRLRRFLRKQPSDLAEVHLEELTSGIVTLLHGDALRRRITLTHTMAARVPPVLGDHVQLEQVVVNLVLNAFDSIVAANADERHVRITVENGSNNEVVVAIVDSGKGIPADQLRSIFEPFVTSKRDGIGMGLAICRMIVDAHGGRIWADNVQGGGARVAFALGAIPPGMQQARSEERHARPIETAPYTPTPRQGVVHTSPPSITP